MADQIQHDMLTGTYVDPAAARTPLGDYAEMWLARMRPTWRGATAMGVESNLRKHVLPSWAVDRCPPSGGPTWRRCTPPCRWRLDRRHRAPAPHPASLRRRRGRSAAPQSGDGRPVAEGRGQQGAARPARRGRRPRRGAPGLASGGGAARRRRRAAPGGGDRIGGVAGRFPAAAAAGHAPVAQPSRRRRRAWAAEDAIELPDHSSRRLRHRGAGRTPSALPGPGRRTGAAGARWASGRRQQLRSPVAQGVPSGGRAGPAVSRPAAYVRQRPSVTRSEREGGRRLARPRLPGGHVEHLRPPHADRRGRGQGRPRRRPRSTG